jgi:hypothetical protein
MCPARPLAAGRTAAPTSRAFPPPGRCRRSPSPGSRRSTPVRRSRDRAGGVRSRARGARSAVRSRSSRRLRRRAGTKSRARHTADARSRLGVIHRYEVRLATGGGLDWDCVGDADWVVSVPVDSDDDVAPASARCFGPSAGSWPAAICSEMPAVSRTNAALAIAVIRAIVLRSFGRLRLVRLGIGHSGIPAWSTAGM